MTERPIAAVQAPLHGDEIRELGRRVGADVRTARRFLKRARAHMAQLDPQSRTADLELFKTLRATEWYLRQGWECRGGQSGIEGEFVLLREQAVNTLVDRNMGLVFQMLNQQNTTEVDGDDLLSHGLWSLLQAVLRFDPWRGFRFSTYACTAIRNGFQLVLRQKRLRDKHIARLQAAYVSSPSLAEKQPDDHREAIKERLSQTFRENLAELTAIERYVIDKRLLTTAKKPSTLEVVGNTLKISKERVRQIQLSGLSKLRASVERSQQWGDASSVMPREER